MRSAADLRTEIESRLRGYLSRDTTGIRHELLTIFVRVRSVTIADTHNLLSKKFTVTYQSVASMVGIIASKIGILRVIRDKDNSTSTYELKDQYSDMVRRIVGTT